VYRGDNYTHKQRAVGSPQGKEIVERETERRRKTREMLHARFLKFIVQW
jgi:hypothetical protein